MSVRVRLASLLVIPSACRAQDAHAIRITTTHGAGLVPFLSSLDWSKPEPNVTRAIVIFHGKGRNVESYYKSALDAAKSAGAAARNTIIIAPQYLDEEDIASSRDLLRWRGTEWESGAPAVTPANISSFEVIDSLLIRLTDRTLFPKMEKVILAGHSGGAQLIQRYAIVGRQPLLLAESSLHLRFVIANPSSYLYFSEERPSKTHGCSHFNRWKYGTEGAPEYVPLDSADWAKLEENYAKRDVIYLLGTADTDPHEKDLDVTCSAETQGSTRFERGKAYYAYLIAVTLRLGISNCD